MLKKLLYITYNLFGPDLSTRIAVSPIGKIAFTILKTFFYPDDIYPTNIGIKLKLSPDWAMYSGIALLGITNPNETEFYRKNVKQGDVAIDIGTHEDGWHGMCVARFGGPTSKVYAFEPIKKYYDYLVDNINLNKLSKKIFPYQLGIYTESGEFKMKESGAASYIDQAKGDIKIQTVRLDEFVKKNKLKKLDILKIDVEGVEFEVLKSAESVINTLKPRIIMIEVIDELLGKYGNSTRDIFKFLEKQGYVANIIKAGGDLEIAQYVGRDKYQCFNWVFLQEKAPSNKTGG